MGYPPINALETLEQLKDVSIPSPSAGDVVTRDPTNNFWIAQPFGGGFVVNAFSVIAASASVASGVALQITDTVLKTGSVDFDDGPLFTGLAGIAGKYRWMLSVDFDFGAVAPVFPFSIQGQTQNGQGGRLPITAPFDAAFKDVILNFWGTAQLGAGDNITTGGGQNMRLFQDCGFAVPVEISALFERIG